MELVAERVTGPGASGVITEAAMPEGSGGEGAGCGLRMPSKRTCPELEDK